MPSLRSLPEGLTSQGRTAFRQTLFRPETDGLLTGVARLSRDYPFPHSIFGGAGCDAYVRGLAARASHPGEGWYGLGYSVESLAAAAYLGIYGFGRGDGHTLWKIRHPLTRGAGADLAGLFEEMVTSAVRARPGTAKFVVFFGENEQDAIHCAQLSGFQCEACFPDYYRLGEKCLVYGRTMR